MNFDLISRVNRCQRWLFVGAIVALIATGIGAWFQPKQFFFSYLFAVLYWLGLSLGCFTLTMLHYLTGGRWGYPTRRFFEAGLMVLPLMLLLFVPIYFGLRQLYPWAQPGQVANDLRLQHLRPYQNTWAYIFRSLIFFGLTIWMGWRLRHWSLAQDATTDAEPTRKARFLSGIGIVLFSLIATFVYVDWIMSLERRWYSTMFAVIVLIGQILLAYAFAIVLLSLFRRQEPIAGVVSQTHYHHLGNLLLTFVLFWTYVSFGQFLIIYSGDIPEELNWYRHRIAGGWVGVLWALALFHFFVPFLLLLFRRLKKTALPLTVIAGLLLLAHVLDMYWLVMPALHPHGPAVSWMDAAAFLAIGSLWLGVFLAHLKSAPLLPQHDPGMQFAFKYGH
jgi:hypothetical protein